MDDHLQRLVHELRRETCPRAVLDRVAARIGQKTSLPRRAWQRWSWVVASACVLAAVAVGHWSLRRDVPTTVAAETQQDRALVIHQTQETLVYVGHALIEAAAHTENAIHNQAVPPLQNAFRTLKTKVNKSL